MLAWSVVDIDFSMDNLIIEAVDKILHLYLHDMYTDVSTCTNYTSKNITDISTIQLSENVHNMLCVKLTNDRKLPFTHTMS